MNNKKIILNLYRSKIKLCKEQGYKLGTYKNVSPDFNLAKSLIKCKKIRNKVKRSNYIMSHVRQGYKDNMYKEDHFMVDVYIDEGFQVLRNLNNLLKLKKEKINDKNIIKIDDDYIFYDYFND